MSDSNFRIKEYDTVHHLTSRIAHRVYFLGEDERSDLLSIIRRSSIFCGIKLLVWCIMTNHFHLLVHLPVRPAIISEEEILQKYEVLKGPAKRLAKEEQLEVMRQQGNEGVKKALAWFDRQRARMYDIGEFMKLVKQWFTQEYNRRNSHVGTLWESVYHDRVVEYKVSEFAKCAGYIHLNPVRAAVCTGFDDYRWSSFTALTHGDAMALAGLRFVYDLPEATSEELVEQHVELLNHMLDKEKRRRAEEIARKRLAGYEAPLDPLTSEALVAQATAHRKLVQNVGVILREESSGYCKCTEKRKLAEDCILSAISENPYVTVDAIASKIDLPKSTVYRYIKAMQERCEIAKPTKNAPWSILKFSI